MSKIANSNALGRFNRIAQKVLGENVFQDWKSRSSISDDLGSAARVGEVDIYRSAYPSASYYAMNLFAAIVASYGLLSNSPAVVIGSMVIAVLLGPIGGIGLSLINGDAKLILWSFVSLITGVIEVFVISYIIGSIHLEYPLTAEILSRTEPNLFDLMIAFFGGCAGAYASERRVPGGTMIGVAIATALVPPISSSAILLAHHEMGLFRGAFLLFLTNLVAIQCAYSATLYILKWRSKDIPKRTGRALLFRLAPSILFFSGLAFVLGSVLNRRVIDLNIESTVRATLDEGLISIPGAVLGETTVHSGDSATNIIAVVRVPIAIAPDQVAALEAELHSRLSMTVHLTVRSQMVRVANSTVYLYQPQELRQVIDQPQAPVVLGPAVDSARIFDSIRAQAVIDSVADSTHRVDSIRVSDSIQHLHHTRRRRR